VAVLCSATVSVTHTWKHKNEVWSVGACPFDAGLVFTGHHASLRNAATLWRMPGVESTGDTDAESGGEEKSSDVVPSRSAGDAAGAGSGPQDLLQLAEFTEHKSRVHTYAAAVAAVIVALLVGAAAAAVAACCCCCLLLLLFLFLLELLLLFLVVVVMMMMVLLRVFSHITALHHRRGVCAVSRHSTLLWRACAASCGRRTARMLAAWWRQWTATRCGC
jgi:hypothetical protein